MHKFGDLAQREKIPQTYLYRRKNEENLFRLKHPNAQREYNPKMKEKIETNKNTDKKKQSSPKKNKFAYLPHKLSFDQEEKN